jgi:hypothetical protein
LFTLAAVAKDRDALASKPMRQSIDVFDVLPRGGAAHIDRLAHRRVHMTLEGRLHAHMPFGLDVMS